LQIRNGDLLTVEINLAENAICWRINENLLADAHIPEVMINKNLFLVLRFYHQNDELQLLKTE
jgi:hypothetical protein